MTKLDGKNSKSSTIEKLLMETVRFQKLAELEVSKNNLEKAKEYLLKAKANLSQMASESNQENSIKIA